MKKFLIVPVALIVFGISALIAYNFFNCSESYAFESSVLGVSSPEVGYVLLPETTTATLNQEVKIQLHLRSDEIKSNLFSAKLTFPSDLVEVKNIDLSEVPSFSKIWVKNDFDNEKGVINLVAGVKTPGFSTIPTEDAAYLATIIFNTKKEGTASISYDLESAIFSNDENENILQLGEGSIINIEPADMPPSKIEQLKSMVGKKRRINRIIFQATPKPTPSSKSC